MWRLRLFVFFDGLRAAGGAQNAVSISPADCLQVDRTISILLVLTQIRTQFPAFLVHLFESLKLFWR